MNWKTCLALLARDARVARRNFVPLLLQTFLQPMMFVFIFGRVMVSSGYMPPAYRSLLLPGIMAISMVFTGVWAVAMPLISEFQFTHEIEDRLLAPINISWLAIEKVFFGTLQSLIAGLAVMTKTEVLLIILGGIFVLEALSVLIQVFSFQTFRKRVFLMAPIHHHFELQAWSETKIILRFWIVASVCAAIGFTLYQQSVK